MKKAFSVLLCFAMVLALVGCSTNEPLETPEPVSSQTGTTGEEQQAAKTADIPDETGTEPATAEPETEEQTPPATAPEKTQSSSSSGNTGSGSGNTGSGSGNTGSGSGNQGNAGNTGSAGTEGGTAPKRKLKYTLEDGTTYELEEGVDPFAYSLKLNTRPTSHQYPEVEQEIVRLCNEERAKRGLPALTWCEDAYYFTKIRAEEESTEGPNRIDHTRPNGTEWYTVYAKVVVAVCGENLAQTNRGTIPELAREIVNGWMNSEGHRENILSSDYTKICVAIIEKDGVVCAAQHFFG